jgi:hypothetical protein
MKPFQQERLPAVRKLLLNRWIRRELARETHVGLLFVRRTETGKK